MSDFENLSKADRSVFCFFIPSLSLKLTDLDRGCLLFVTFSCMPPFVAKLKRFLVGVSTRTTGDGPLYFPVLVDLALPSGVVTECMGG
mmetsp:Transcript_27502/g.35510  ORF Transcript_27502/g.35510 Transcript_27502/m.35510 type:complete len:88 (+) Transcript_27502:301-564(+)